MSSDLFSPVVLRSGGRLRNRIAKAAMEEGMAGSSQLPDERLISLYRRWGAGGAGLLITGNAMVHAEALTGPGGRAKPRLSRTALTYRGRVASHQRIKQQGVRDGR